MTPQEKGIHIVCIKGTARPGNYTSMAMDIVADELKTKDHCTFEVLDPATLNLPFPGQDIANADTEKIKASVSKATGVILSTPEYHGGYSSTIKLVIENLGFPSVLSGKPIALLGVAAGQIGAIKSLESLRSVCSHIGAIVLPGPVSVAGVQGVFDKNGKCLDEKIEKRIRSVAENLIGYIHDHICPRFALESMVRETTEV